MNEMLLLTVLILAFLYIKEVIKSYNDWIDSENEIEELKKKLEEAEKTLYVYTINIDE